MFQRRHYEATAQTRAERNAPLDIVEGFVQMFQRDNPRFLPDRFRAAATRKDRPNA